MMENQLDKTDEHKRCFGGVGRLYSDPGADCLAASAACVVGLGGVGSWAAEALVRTNIGTIYLIDLDNVAQSNTNRQVQAMQGEYGKPKVQALAERFARINPLCKVVQIEEMIDEENAAELIPAGAVLLDCIDQVRAKAAMIAVARSRGQTVITCGAAGGRRDPFRAKRDDLALAEGDPLLSRVRHTLRKKYGFPKATAKGRDKKFQVTAVYSDEPIVRSLSVCEVQTAEGLSCAGYGSSVMVTAPIGMMAAAIAVEKILEKSLKQD
jgi:tRNA A37 threonylcarbamoyladenosine dehydratase